MRYGKLIVLPKRSDRLDKKKIQATLNNVDEIAYVRIEEHKRIAILFVHE